MRTKGLEYWFYICVVALVAFTSVFSACDRMEDDLVPSAEVKLTASLSPVLSSVYTKAEIKSDHKGNLRIGLTKLNGNAVLPAWMYAPAAEDLGLRKIKFDEFQGFPDASSTLSYVGWYPLDDSEYTPASGGDAAKVGFRIPSDASTDILFSDVASGTRLSGFNTMTFRHALVKYSIKVYAMETDDAKVSVSEEWGKINSVTLEDMPSTCILTLPKGSETLPAVSFGTETQKLTVVKETPLSIPVGFSQAADLASFLAPEPVNNILSLVVNTEKGGSTRQTLSLATDFQMGKHYQIYLRFTTHGVINAEIVIEDWEDVNNPVDVEGNTGIYYNLSESQTANTYIVSSAYSYCFDATLRGNGYTGVVGIPGALDGGDSIYKVGDAVTAEVVWTDIVSGVRDESVEPAEDVNNLDKYFRLSPALVEGKVYFTIPQSGATRALPKEGNVVVAVKDKNDKILWTWHIWLTDRPHEQGYKNGFTVQDRDLGATAYNAEDEQERSGINGLFYKWGRPTPLPLSKDVYSPVYDATTGEWKNNRKMDFVSSQDELSIVNRVAAPDTYFDAKATAKEGTLTKHLWGWRTESDEYAKTIYDPCPPGYRVPSVKLWRDLEISGAATVVKEKGKDIAAKFEVEANHAVVYYPMTGYYKSRLSREEANRGAYMWAATFYVGKKDDAVDDRPYALDFAYGSENGNDFQEMEIKQEYSNYALPVRCISRMSKAHVTDLSDYQTANSYIVPKAGYYKFKATVRGNGVGQLVSPGSSSTIVLTEQLSSVDIKNQLVRVEPLWWHTSSSTSPTKDALNSNEHFSLLNEGKPDADGYVSFNVQDFYEGNLILAGRDAKGDIIWSWHIWFTDTPDLIKSNSYEIMDRNLGAIHAPKVSDHDLKVGETYGLYYQWGRKDPFLDKGTTVYKYDAASKTYSELPLAFGVEDAADSKTVANSVLNPMTFYKASSSDNTGVFNMDDTSIMDDFSVTETNNKTENQCFSNMVHPEHRESLWGYSAMKNEYGVTSTKTMYDPCPPGYSVAYYLVWTNTERDNTGGKSYYSNLDGGFVSHGLTVESGSGLFINKGLNSDDQRYDKFGNAWFPYSGYINGASYELRERGTMGVFHTATPAGNGSRDLMYDSTRSGQGISGSSLGMPSTFAYPVRCQKE